MIRIVIENAFFFFLPTLIYLAYIAFTRDAWPGLWRVLSAAPLVKLFVLGAALMLTTLTLFSTRDGHDPRAPYTPDSYSDGKLNQGSGR
ncbi:MAG: DUF6111 family protein [Hyphomicrobium sp.]